MTLAKAQSEKVKSTCTVVYLVPGTTKKAILAEHHPCNLPRIGTPITFKGLKGVYYVTDVIQALYSETVDVTIILQAFLT